MASVGESIDKMFDKIDADHSGSISKAEMDVAFHLFDTDGQYPIKCARKITISRLLSYLK